VRNTSYVDPVIGGKRNARGADEAIAMVAQRQHGVVARRQLSRLGLGRRAIDHRLQSRRLHPLHRGVYAVGHLGLSGEARLMAAVLAGGVGAALSHRSAAALWGILPSARRRIEVTARRARRDRGPEIQFTAHAWRTTNSRSNEGSR
jgi:hypothetical protein